MSNKLKTKNVIAAVVGVAFLGLVALPASALTEAEITAQINVLMAQLAAMKSGGSATTSAPAASYSFTRDLTVGSRGDDVSALQTWLESKGFLTMPAGVAKGYFGSLTKAAVAKYQVSAGVSPSVGYFGSITRGKLNSAGGVSTAPGTGSSTSTVPVGITTPGVEGTLTATQSNIDLATTLYVGDMKAAILGAKLEAKNSDILVKRVKIDLGTSTNVYTKVFKTFYVFDEAGNQLAMSDLNSSTVVKDGGVYYLTISGFNLLVPRNTNNKRLVIKADLFNSIESTDRATQSASLLRIAALGIRGTDGVGIDQYSPQAATTISRQLTVSANLNDSAEIIVSKNSASPVANVIVASGGTNRDEADKVAVLAVDLQVKKDKVKVTDLTLNVDKTGSGTATATEAYLYDGSTLISNVSITNGVASFTNIDRWIEKDTTATWWVKIDVRSAGTATSSWIATLTSANVVAENSVGTMVQSSLKSGSAVSEALTGSKIGLVLTLVSKNATKTSVAGSSGSTATSTIKGDFTVKVKAVGGSVYLGTTGSTSPAFASSTTFFSIYKNSASDGLAASYYPTVSYDTPTGITTESSGTTMVLSDGQETTLTFTGAASVPGTITSGSYAVQFEGLRWYNATVGAGFTNFMNGKSDWRTSTVSLP